MGSVARTIVFPVRRAWIRACRPYEKTSTTVVSCPGKMLQNTVPLVTTLPDESFNVATKYTLSLTARFRLVGDSVTLATPAGGGAGAVTRIWIESDNPPLVATIQVVPTLTPSTNSNAIESTTAGVSACTRAIV